MGKGAYYNEHDPFAAAWLRELIRDKKIANGEVDERSIEDVRPGDLAGYTQCHFFAGIGVWSLALREAGWPDDRPIWTGSCPCQPFSAAGKAGGFADERHLWPAFYHLIGECRPAIVVGEQVASKDGLAWLDLVSADMEGARYAIGAVDTCAAGFGAPHIRQRLYFGAQKRLADPQGSRRTDGETITGSSGSLSAKGTEVVGVGDRLSPVRLADADSRQRERLADGEGRERDRETTGRIESNGIAQSGGDVCGLADASGEDQGGRRVFGPGQSDGASTRAARERSARLRADGGMADADGGNASAEGLQRSGEQRQQSENGGAGIGMADADDARSQGRGERRHSAGERIARSRGLECEEPGRPGATNGLWRNADWLFCRDGKWRPVEPGTFPLADAGTFRNRVAELRGAGNAINLAQAVGFLEAFGESLDPRRNTVLNV